jgi:hypothetical protein
MVKGVLSLAFPQSHNLSRKVSQVDTFDDLEDVTASNDNVGIGQGAIEGTTSSGIVSIGFNAGNDGVDVKDESVIIGYQAGALGCGEKTVAIGTSAGHGVNAKDADNSVMIGARACTGLSGTYNDDCVVIGSDAGIGGTGASSVAIGDTASAKGDRNISIGKNCNLSSTSTQSICVGENAGRGSVVGTLQGNDFICLGNEVGQAPDMKSKSISIGSKETNLGFSSATSDNGIGYASIAIGASCNGVANSTAKRGNLAVMIGPATAYNGAGEGAVSIGAVTGLSNVLGANTVSIGHEAAQGTSSGTEANSVCIGYQAGKTGAGSSSVLIGQAAQGVNDNCIMLNASGSTTTTAVDGAFYVDPIKVGAGGSAQTIKPPSDSGFTSFLCYNPTTKEIRAVVFS